MKWLWRIARVAAGLALVGYLGLVAYAYWPNVPPGVSASSLAVEADRFATVSDLNIRYRLRNTGAPGPTLVFIHGFGNALESFEALVAALPSPRQALLFDLPGFGLSDKPADFQYDNAGQAAVLPRLLDALKIDQAILVGHSLGGAIAVHAASDRRICGLALVNPGIISTGVPAGNLMSLFPLPRIGARLFSNSDFRRRSLENSFATQDSVTEAMVDRVMLGTKTEDYWSGMTAMMSAYSEGQELPLLGNIRQPTLILWGDLDRSKPLEEADQLAALVPGSMLKRYPDAGHYVHEEKPAVLAIEIDQLARRCGEI